MSDRDPRLNPQAGDVIEKSTNIGTTLTRTVVRRENNDIFYTSGDNVKVRKCWISTWMEWCRDSEVKTVAPYEDKTDETN